jgi:ribosomal protein S12 methylthiotransferase accessory factor YcaO
MFESLRKSGWTGVAVLVGAAALAPTVLPAVGRAARPAAKSALKAGLLTAEQARERMAEITEAADDLWAEVRHELDEERRSPADAAGSGGGSEVDDSPERPAADAL